MPNMDYCRFHNTANDLRDCYEHMDDADIGEAEKKERRRLIELCANIADDYRDEIKD